MVSWSHRAQALLQVEEGRGVGIDVRGQTECVSLARNEIRETRQPMSRIGIRIGAKASEVKLAGNRLFGLATEVRDLRPSSS
jgi:hypothetical protein